MVETEAIDRVWSATGVNFDLVTEGEDQLVAYYNATRNLVVAHRKTSTGQAFYGSVWNYRQLDTMLGWDNHNDVVAAITKDRHFHVLGNMHADRLVYYKTRYPGEIRSLERVEMMVDAGQEKRVTYPQFLRGADGATYLQFRIGGSGDGNQISYRYDDQTGSWSQPHPNGFTDGQGKHSAYFSAIVLGPDGRFHTAFVWRAHGGSTMNSMVSYARSADLMNWEDAAGKPLTLPLTYDATPVAAPVRNEQGMVNGHQHVGFDAQGRPLVTYFRYDANRIAQAYLARFNGTAWEQHQITNLTEVIHHKNRRGNDTPGSVGLSDAPVLNTDGTIRLDAHLLNRPVTLTLDGATLKLRGQCEREATPGPLVKWAAHADGKLRFRTMQSRGNPADKDHITMLSWHAMPGNRDRAFEDISEPSSLRIHVLKAAPKAGQPASAVDESGQ